MNLWKPLLLYAISKSDLGHCHSWWTERSSNAGNPKPENFPHQFVSNNLHSWVEKNTLKVLCIDKRHIPMTTTG